MKSEASFERSRMSSRPRADLSHTHGAPPAHPQSDRRRTRRGADGEPSRSRLVNLILGTYDEMPGTSLHVPQAARLFGLRETTCSVVLDDLVRDGRLRRSRDGQYRAVNGGDF
jgi:hypothetical protein